MNEKEKSANGAATPEGTLLKIKNSVTQKRLISQMSAR